MTDPALVVMTMPPEHLVPAVEEEALEAEEEILEALEVILQVMAVMTRRILHR